MNQSLKDAVEDFRRRIEDSEREAQRLQGAILELEASAASAEDDRRNRAALKRTRAELEKARDATTELKRIYARFRLREGLGKDPASVDDDLFDEELLAWTRKGLRRKGIRDPREGPMFFDTCREMLLADLSLEQVAENLHAARKRGPVANLMEEGDSTQAVLRQWAAKTVSDPYVAEALERATALAERFDSRLADLQHGLEDLRVNYEIKRGSPDRLAVRADGARCVLQAENDWEEVQQAFPAEAEELVATFHELSQARQELAASREALNAELKSFMSAFVALYLRYVRRQSRERRRELGVEGVRLRRLVDALLDEIENTDFLLPGGGGLEVPSPRIPHELSDLARTPAYRERVREDEPPAGEHGAEEASSPAW